MSEEEEGALPREIKGALVLVVACLVILGLITLLDMQIKRAIVDQAVTFRREMLNAQQPRQRAPAAGVPGPVPGVSRGSGVDDAAGPPQDGMAAEAPAVVHPGDESARPPHRGSVDGA